MKLDIPELVEIQFRQVWLDKFRNIRNWRLPRGIENGIDVLGYNKLQSWLCEIIMDLQSLHQRRRHD